MNEKIFVSIPTMNDSEYLPTIERLLSSAQFPERVHIGTTIFWKKDDLPIYGAPFFYKFIKELESKYSSNVSFDVLPWEKYKGVGNGRIEPLKHYNNEKYYLSLDSHTVCIKNWDRVLIERYENAKKYFGRMICLTTYLPNYYSEDDKKNLSDVADDITDSHYGLDIDLGMNVVFPKGDSISRWQFFDYNHHLPRKYFHEDYIFPFPNDCRLSSDSKVLDNIIEDQYLPAKKISAHFTFTEANPWLTGHRINLHPDILFWGEEFYQSCLAYARGYNLVWIKDPIFFHHYVPLTAKKVTISNYENNNSLRRIEEIIEYDSFSDKNNIFNQYINSNDELNNKIRLEENIAIKNLLENKDFFGHMPRSTMAFCRYAKINVLKRTTAPWWEVPKIDIIFK
jgi:hypothetical protein